MIRRSAVLRRRRPRLWAVALLALAIPALAACGSDEEEATTSAQDEIVIEHAFGETTVERTPQRVVALDLPWSDTLLALGVEPIAISAESYMPDAQVPWQDVPTDVVTLEVYPEIPIEQIAELEPDLIVGSFAIGDRRTYDLLSAIAPTVAGLSDAQVDDWRDLSAAAGEIFGVEDEAAALVADVDGQIEQRAAELPGLAGKSYELAQYVVGDALYVVGDEEDGSSLFFQQLGMTMFEPVREQSERLGEPRLKVSTERADLLGADLVAFLVNGGDESDLDDIPGFDTLPGAVGVFDIATITGLNTPTPLSIPYALQQIGPTLEAAAR